MVNAANINLVNIQKKFNSQVTALENINLSFQPGDFVSILGPSGCGKSTLLRIIAGLEQPTNGNVECGINKNEMGFVFQEAHLLPWRNVFQNITLPLELENKTSQIKNMKEQVMLALEKLDIADAATRHPHELSGGMKMRASLARALVKKPKLLLLDEPFAALDEMIRQKLCEELRQLWEKEKITVLFVTHSLTEACFLSERCIIMSPKPGKIIFDERLNLPSSRTNKIRTSIEFMNAVEKLYQIMRGTQNER